MDLKFFFTTFSMIFLAELGDKTQICTLGFAAGSESRLTVFLASSAALITTSAMAVLMGEAFCRVVPAKALHIVSGAGFVVIGLFMLSREVWK